MAVEPQQGAISAAFPAPPPFYKSFTTENIERVQHHQEPSSESTSEAVSSTAPLLPSISDNAALPADLRNLRPPTPPADGKYRSFGALHDINPLTTTTPAVPTRTNLLNLTDRLLQLFRRYIHIMATNPSGELWIPQWEEIKKTFEQIHGIINEYRPHEARESLILRYEDQIWQVREETERVKTSVERAKKVVEELGSSEEGRGTHTESEESKMPSKNEWMVTREKRIWEIINAEVGEP